MKNRLTGMFTKKWVLWVIIAILLTGMVLLVKSINTPESKVISYTELEKKIEAGLVTSLIIQGDMATAVAGGSKGVERFTANIPNASPILPVAKAAKIEVVSKDADSGNSFAYQMFITFGPVILLGGIWLYFARRAQGGPGRQQGPAAMSGSKAAIMPKEALTVRFSDVAGCDEAKEEVREFVEFLRDAERYKKVGGYIPSGALLVGPPGTGKTLLAKAIAGEAGVPFLTISGSDFVEMFVGVGAARVRSLFEQAKKMAPCIVFIDEIDAVGRHRGSGNGGGNDEREQTLNQMLVEMDGFKQNSGVIVLAATNRAEVLDKALTRPGRFDRQIHVGLPDLKGRIQILKTHMRKVPVAPQVDLEVLAKGTTGFAGANLQNLVNLAALRAGKANKSLVDMTDFTEALDDVTMGPERKSIRMPEDERVNTGYHESGHAVVAALLPTADPVHKVSIMPRGRALGITLQLPDEDRYSLSRSKILDNIAILFAGRIAEDMFTGEITTGASNDYERATALARNMVTRWGMSDDFGQMVLGDTSLDAFSGASQRGGALAEATLQKADAEIKKILQTQYNRARHLLEENRDIVEAMTKALLAWETIDAKQVAQLMARQEPTPPQLDSGLDILAPEAAPVADVGPQPQPLPELKPALA